MRNDGGRNGWREGGREGERGREGEVARGRGGEGNRERESEGEKITDRTSHQLIHDSSCLREAHVWRGRKRAASVRVVLEAAASHYEDQQDTDEDRGRGEGW